MRLSLDCRLVLQLFYVVEQEEWLGSSNCRCGIILASALLHAQAIV